MANRDPNPSKALTETFIEAYNAFDVDTRVSLMHPECSFQNVSGGEVNACAEGLAQFRELAESSKALFSSRRQTITGYHEEAGTVTVEIAYEGVFRIDIPNGPKAGQTLSLAGRSIYELRDNLICRLTDYS
jgi:hypothetical protein